MSISRVKTSSILQGFPKGRSLLTGNDAFIPNPVVTGGTLTSDATYYYRTFTASGTLDISVSSLTADIFMIGGGGASAYLDWTLSQPGAAGGAGAGGAVYGTEQLFTPSSYVIAVGAGGSNIGGQSGNDSTFNSITAKGGGGNRTLQGNIKQTSPGGCGGGASDQANPGNISNQGSFSGYTSYGNRGGRPISPNSYNGGKVAGGGGIGGFVDYGGGTGNTTEVRGGPGLNTWSSWATATSTGVSGFYGGGGGGINGFAGYGAGGSGGGGAGNNPNGFSGTANTGGGGGTAGSSGYGMSTYGGNGGSGLFIIRYTKVQVD